MSRAIAGLESRAVYAGTARPTWRALAFVAVFAALASAALGPFAEPNGGDGRAAAEDRRGTYGQLPLAFEANRGQTDRRVDFLMRGGPYTLFLRRREAVFALHPGAGQRGSRRRGGRRAVVRMELMGSLPGPGAVASRRLQGKVNSFVGDDPSAWRRNIPTFGGVSYESVYEGIDVKYYGRGRQLEYDFLVSPRADYRQVDLRFDGVRRLSLDGRGNLIIDTPAGRLRHDRPDAYQRIGGAKRPVPARYRIVDENRVRFDVGSYDRAKQLVIDPKIRYSTYLGGTSYDSGRAVAADSDGNAYVAGITFSPSFPSGQSRQGPGGQADAFVTKLAPDGSRAIYTTFLGGSDAPPVSTPSDEVSDIAVDGDGNAYLAGSTISSNFPTQNAQQGDAGQTDAFLAKLSPDGSSLVFSTYLGGGDVDGASGVALDRLGNVHVSGVTNSGDFPTTPTAFQREHFDDRIRTGILSQYQRDLFLTKFDPAGASRLYSTYLGGDGDEFGAALALDSNGTAYLGGGTNSTNFPTTAGVFRSRDAGTTDGYVTKLDTTVAGAGGLVYSTYYGGPEFDAGFGIAVDDDGRAYLAGITASHTDFPLERPLQSELRGSADAFVGRVSRDGSRLEYSTYLGGAAEPSEEACFPRTNLTLSYATGEFAFDVAVDGADRAVVGGMTSSADFPVRGGPQRRYGGGRCDAFVSKLAADGSSLSYSTFLGGRDADAAYAVEADRAGNAYVTGTTASSDFPETANVVQDEKAGELDAFITKLEPVPADLFLVKTDSPDPVLNGQRLTYTLRLRNDGPNPAAGIAIKDALPDGLAFVSAAPGCRAEQTTVLCDVGVLAAGATTERQIVVRPTRTGTVTNTAVVSSDNEDPNERNNTTSEFTEVRPAADLKIEKSDATDPVRLGGNVEYTLKVTNDGPNDAPRVTAKDTLPENVDFVSASDGCVRSGQTVTCDLGTLRNGQSTTRDVVVKPRSRGRIENKATVESPPPPPPVTPSSRTQRETPATASQTPEEAEDPNRANNSAREPTEVIAQSEPEPEPEPEPEVRVRGAREGGSGDLPFTGLSLAAVALVGFALVSGGAILRRRTR